jgi:hypothetical protein
MSLCECRYAECNYDECRGALILNDDCSAKLLPYKIKGSDTATDNTEGLYHKAFTVVIDGLDKLTSLLSYRINCDRNKEYDTGPRGLYYKTFYGRNLRIFVIT